MMFEFSSFKTLCIKNVIKINVINLGIFEVFMSYLNRKNCNEELRMKLMFINWKQNL